MTHGNKKQPEKTTDQKKEFLALREAVQFTGLCPITLRKFADEGQIQCYRTPGSGHRKYNRQSLQRFCSSVSALSEIPENNKTNFIYARVSSKKQMDDLDRQIEFLRSYDSKYSSYVCLSDVASGLNFKRQGLQTILEACVHQIIGEIVVTHRDRLCRFAFELIESIVERCGGRIVVLDDEQHHGKSTDQELAEDVLSIIHIYSCRQMGKRSHGSTKNHQHQSQNRQNSNISNKVPENHSEGMVGYQ